MDELEKLKIREKQREFWELYFLRRQCSHQALADLLQVGNDTVSHWVHGTNAMKPEYLSKLLKSNSLTPKEATILTRLCLQSLGFSESSIPFLATALGVTPINKDKLTTRTNLRSTDFPKLIAAAQEQIDILQTYIPNVENMRNALSDALKNGCTIRIMVLKLDSIFLKARLTHLRANKGAIEHSLNELEKLTQESRSFKGTIKIKNFDFLCYFPYHRIDNRVFAGFYLKEGSSKHPQIGMSVDEITQFFPDLLQHFEDFWNRQDNELLVSNRDTE